MQSATDRKKHVRASSNETPCLTQLLTAFLSFQMNRVYMRRFHVPQNAAGCREHRCRLAWADHEKVLQTGRYVLISRRFDGTTGSVLLEYLRSQMSITLVRIRS
jgi:hypothetical protein